MIDPTHRNFRAKLGLPPMPLKSTYLISWLDHDRITLAVSEYYGDRERAISWACETMRAGRLEETINAYGFVVTLKPPDTNDGKLSNA